MQKNPTYFERLLEIIKNNRVMAILLAFGTSIIAIWAFMDAAKNIVNIMLQSIGAKTENISGVWETEKLQGSTPIDYCNTHSYKFDLKQLQNTVIGTFTPICDDKTLKYRAISNGIVEGDYIAFQVKYLEEVIDPMDPVTGKYYHTETRINKYYGKILGQQIQFEGYRDLRWAAQSDPVEKFTAQRSGTSP